MSQKYLKVGSLALLQVVIVGNLQVLPANAVYGLSLPFLFLLAAIGFFIPTAIMTARMAVRFPQTGGAYIWAEQAFGKKTGFFTFSIYWICNLLWYPSIFALIAANFAYLFDPELSQNKYFIVSCSLFFFWAITGLNCLGMKITSRVSVICSWIGIILPMLLIIVCALIWSWSGNPIALSLAKTPLIPDLSDSSNLGLLIAIVTSLFGIELAAVHAADVVNPKRNFPLSLILSSAVVLTLLLGAELSIAAIIPTDELNLMTGLLDALKSFFQKSHLEVLLFPVLFIVLLGNIGSTSAWMFGSTRGMLIACQKNHVGRFLQKTNSRQAPVGILVVEALIFSIASGIFLLFPKVTDTFWLLLAVASEINLIYYIILFAATMRLLSFSLVMTLGILTSLLAFAFGCIPPPDLMSNSHLLFYTVQFAGILFALALPLILLYVASGKTCNRVE